MASRPFSWREQSARQAHGDGLLVNSRHLSSIRGFGFPPIADIAANADIRRVNRGADVMKKGPLKTLVYAAAAVAALLASGPMLPIEIAIWFSASCYSIWRSYPASG